MVRCKKIYPKCDDQAVVSALGFFQNPAKLLQTEAKVTAPRAADSAARSSSLFVYSDKVAPRYVGDKLARVLKILPLKKGAKHDMVHERFTKPFYYPVRTNKIENINFILTDETGNPVEFASGRVLIGLHLKRFV